MNGFTEFLSNWGTEIFFALTTAGALALSRRYYSKSKKLQEYKEEDQNRKNRQMILDEIQPIIDELAKVEKDMKSMEAQMQVAMDKMQNTSESTHEHMYADLEKIQQKNEHNFALILNSYKFRLIQLCKSHLRDNFITESDFEQITEMYKLYHGLGGNGQAQEYYDKVLQLDIRPDEQK